MLSEMQVMFKQKWIAKTPRERFMQAVDDELAKFVRKEVAFQRAERDERATQLRLPLARHLASHQNRERE